MATEQTLTTAPAKAPPPTTREEDPRTRAARRAAELREHRGSLDDGVDKFYIDPTIIPDGWSYEWKNHTILGQPNPSYEVNMARAGWEPVPRTRHPELMPENYAGNTIIRDGQILMERPLEITKEAVERDKRAAKAQMQGKEAQLAGAPPGTFDRDNKGTPLASIKKSYEPMQIPK
jgi:hypothetical protein